MSATFDVFDTVLSRSVGSPHAVFLLLGKRARQLTGIDLSPQVFAAARMAAESRVRHSLGPDGVTLERIYAELSHALGLSPPQGVELMAAECALEANLLRPIPGARERLRSARAGSRAPVEFVADTHLPAGFIEQQLRRHRLYEVGDRCYAAGAPGERGTTTASGERFGAVLVEPGAEPGEVCPHGGDPDVDGQRARRAGLQGPVVCDVRPNRYEATLDSFGEATDGLAAVLAGASRLARLGVDVSSRLEGVRRDIAAGVVAPTLTAYVLWVLHRAERLGLRRLYFVSREGQILLQIARRLASKLNVSCELRYLYGSRQAWHLPAITKITDDTLRWILDETSFLSVRSLLARVGIRPEEVRRELAALGLGEARWSRNLRPRERQALRALFDADALRALTLQRAAERRSLVLRYFAEQGLLDPVDAGLVDVGWTGRLLGSLAALLAPAGADAPLGFYFFIEGGYDLPPDIREAYYYDRPRGLGLGLVHAVPYFGQLLETFCAADHGTVVGYREVGGQVEPELERTCDEAAIAWGLPLVHQTVCAFVENLYLGRQHVDPRIDLRPAIAAVLHPFCVSPSREEAEAWGSFPYEDAQGDGHWARFAERYGWRDVVTALRTQGVVLHQKWSWAAGSRARSPIPVRLAMRVAGAVGRRVR
ncbi:MAG: hypothetical protein ACRDJN_07220 [Chloroflexota bacterium]